MQTQQAKKAMLDPYRNVGNFVSGRISLSQSTPPVLTVPTGTSFKIYSTSLTIKVASPPFPTPLTATVSYNEYTYVRTRDRVIKMKYHHIVSQWNLQGANEKCTLLRFDKLIIVAESNLLALIDEQDDSISVCKYGFTLLGVIHPVTYVNKLVVFSKSQLMLVNAVSQKILYEFPKLQQFMQQNELSICECQPTPLVDIICVCFSEGTIAFLNLRKDQIVFTLKQKLTPSAVAFSTQQSWMATSDHIGNVILWDLEDKRILYKFQKCIEGPIDSLVFIPGMPILTCASSTANCLRQLRVNLEDSKILTLYRQRVGNQLPLERIIIGGNNELVLSSASESMFMSFYGQCNNYLLPRTLDSRLPYHLITHNFTVQLYKQRSLFKTFKLSEFAMLGKISISNKYYIVATQTRLIKLGASYETTWKISNVLHIVLFNQHYIYAFTPQEIVVCDFNTDTIVRRILKYCQIPNTNLYSNLLAFWNKENHTLEIWDMEKIEQGRVFALPNPTQVLCLSFTSDNKFLISSHRGGGILIWNVVDNQLYKQLQMIDHSDILWHCFTPDNQFMVSVTRGKKQANVWNNYIGKVSSSRTKQLIAFTPQIRIFAEDYRKQLQNDTKQQKIQFQIAENDIIDSIPDAGDAIHEYDFRDIAKWMPLAFYDQIKAKNTPNLKGDAPSIPFFLDFRNLTEEKRKIEQEMRIQSQKKKKAYQQNKDKYLSNQSNEIILNDESTEDEFLSTFTKLTSLSIAQVDYQLRKFLLDPSNKGYLLTMMIVVLGYTGRDIKQQLKDIVLHRIITIIGTDIVDSELKGNCSQLLGLVSPILNSIKEKVNRCIAIADKAK